MSATTTLGFVADASARLRHFTDLSPRQQLAAIRRPARRRRLQRPRDSAGHRPCGRTDRACARDPLKPSPPVTPRSALGEHLRVNATGDSK